MAPGKPHRNTVVRWIVEGHIDGFKRRGRWFVYRDRYVRWLQAQIDAEGLTEAG